MPIFRSEHDLHAAVNAVVQQGFAVVNGTKSSAVPFCRKIIDALEQYPDIAAGIGYQNVPINDNFYFVWDLNRFEVDDPVLKRLIDEVDEQNPEPW